MLYFIVLLTVLPSLALLLRDYKEQVETRRFLLGRPLSDTDFVFAHPDGRPLDPSSVTHTFMKYSEKVFSSLVAFYFDADFLYSITSDMSKLNKARKCFEGNSGKGIEDAYIIARGQIGLS